LWAGTVAESDPLIGFSVFAQSSDAAYFRPAGSRSLVLVPADG